MNRCLLLAKRGIGFVSPNPLVGAVIVRNGSKIGEGYHKMYGGAHAEVNAIRDALEKKQSLHGVTIYINLEPCFHYGKTPPCVDAIIHHGFSRVVIAMVDPNPLVAGKSIKKLKEHSVKVSAGLLQKQALLMNEKFITHIQRKTPFVALKAAQTSDGFISQHIKKDKWITNLQSRRYVHRLRSEYDAILVGANTVIQDDSLLTVRGIKRPNPIRIVVDGNFLVPETSRIFNAEAKTILYTTKRSATERDTKRDYLERKGVDIIILKDRKGKLNIVDIMHDLHK
ncbi:MAG: bifunctional diaminohydroxyphosphoribosylaminopyrimidine deaminase/5-amino-6-(5-phosphoribosylamino)uracil reductase RibD, partial [Candidatus Paceibacterota bacterium]